MPKRLYVIDFHTLFLSSHAQYNFDGVNNLLKKYQKQLGNDIVVLINKDDKNIYKKESEEFKASTDAQIASCSKWLTAALVMALVDEGKISLDDKVSDYLPIFAKYSKSYITIRHCLSHMTGIQSDGVFLTLLKRSKYETLEEEVNDFASKREIESNPGTEFKYSNVGMNIAGRVLEVVTKKSFEQLIQTRITRPLQMKGTSFSSERAINPSGGAKSTANDYMNFMTMLLNKGMFKGKRILSEASVAELQKVQTTPELIKFAPKSAEGYNYALGSWVQEADETGKPTVLACPGLFGTWPMVDFKRKYAAIIFVKSILSDQKATIYKEIKDAIDDAIGGG